jgi:hypothetical protein
LSLVGFCTEGVTPVNTVVELPIDPTLAVVVAIELAF